MNFTSQKIALLSANWSRWEHRLLSGGLRFADTQQRIVIRPFAPFHDLKAAVSELDDWGAQGIVGILENDDLTRLLAALKRPLPIVNCALAGEHPGVVTVLGDITAFLELGVGHFRQLGLRSFGMLLADESPILEERLVRPFLKMVKATPNLNPALVIPVNRNTVWNPDAEVAPLPDKLTQWLRRLPKPAGIVCPQLGGGGYLIRCCKQLGLRVPEDVAVVGSDDTDLSLSSDPTLTSVVLSMDLVGHDAVRTLAEMIAGHPPESNIVRLKSAELIVRESTGRRRPEICDIAGALECIQTYATRGITVEQVIRQTQRVSRVTFHRRFREATGKSPAEAIRHRQLEEVRRLLMSTELPVSMISDLAGFSSSKVLARTFRQVERTSPREFRKKRQAYRQPTKLRR
jgi:LacI family transcriptional regulator